MKIGKMRDKLQRMAAGIKNKLMVEDFISNNSGMGVVEIILIILVLVGLVVIFKSQITNIVNSVFSKITSKVNAI